MPIDPNIPLGASIGPQVDPYRAFDFALRMRQAKRLEEQDAQEAQYRQQVLQERQAALADQQREREQKQQATQEFNTTLQRVFESGEPSSLAVQQELIKSGHADLFMQIEPHLRGFDEARKKIQDAKLDATRNIAATIHKFGNTPQALEEARPFFKEIGWTDEELAPYYQRAQEDPKSIAFMTSRFAGDKIKEEATGKTREVKVWNPETKKEEIRVIEDVAGQTFEAPPASSQGRNPTEASLALEAAGGDAAKAFQMLNAKPAGAGPKPRPVTSGDAGKLAQINSSLMQLDSLRKRLSGTHTTGTAAAIGAAAPKFVTDITGFGIEAKEKQAGIDLVKQIIGKALEGGVLRKEDEAKYAKILPTIGDTPAVVSSKLDGLEAEIKSHKANTLDALSDAGYDVNKYAARAEPGGGGGGGQPKATHRYNPATGKVEAIK